MPPLETTGFSQHLVIWYPSGVDEDNEVTLVSPIGLKCRWIDVVQEIADPYGNLVKIEAELRVDRELPTRAIVWKGKLANLPSPNSSITDLYEVCFRKTGPSICSKFFRRSVYLKRFSNSLPELA